MPLKDPPPASIWPMDLTSDLQNIEMPLDAYIKKMEGEIKTFKHDIKKMKRSYDFAGFVSFLRTKKSTSFSLSPCGCRDNS